MRKVLALSGLALALGAPAWGGIVWDNGPLITTSGGGFNGADVSELWTAGGANTLGFGHQVLNGNRMADNFTLDQDYFLKTATFYAYQTGSTTQSTITAVNVRIWDGMPGGGGSVIFGDNTTNRMLSTGWSGIYRATDTAPLANTRPIMEQVVDLEGILLPAGNYWIDWQTAGTLASGPWAPPVTDPPGSFYVGDALQSISDNGVTWNPALDTGNGLNVDMPFLIDGNAVPAPGALALLMLGGLAARRRR